MKKLFLLALMLFNGNAIAALECYNDRGQYFSWTMGEMVPYLDTEPGVYVDCSSSRGISPESATLNLLLWNGQGKTLRSFTGISGLKSILLQQDNLSQGTTNEGGRCKFTEAKWQGVTWP
jgi:hypothetical protein